MITDVEIDMAEITLLLKQNKKLEVISDIRSLEINLGFAFCLHVQDENKKQSSLLINHNNSNQKVLHAAKIKAKYLKSLNHPNIVQYIDDFSIGNYYFLQTERIYESLFNWINEKADNKQISQYQYVDIATQMLDTTFYLNRNKCNLSLESTLSCFAFDQEMKVKLIHFVTPQAINIAQVKSTFDLCRKRDQIFYYKKNILTMDNNCKIWHVLDLDFWAIGICLYHLSGASTTHILNFLQSVESYNFSEFIGFQNNVILYTLIQGTSIQTSLPSISRMIGSFQLQMKYLNQNGERTEKYFQEMNITEDYHRKVQVIKEDFQVFQKTYTEIQGRHVEESQNHIMKELMIKYGLCDEILQLQTKFFLYRNNFDEAIRCSEQIIEINPLSDTAYFNIGTISELKGESLDSIEFYKKSLAINPWNSDTYHSLGVAYGDISLDNAIKYYKKAVEINTNNNECSYYNLGIDLATFEQVTQAIQTYKLAIKLNNKDLHLLINLAQDYLEKSKFEKSMYVLKQSIKLKEVEMNVNILKHLKSLI